jgi:hypothetical protein
MDFSPATVVDQRVKKHVAASAVLESVWVGCQIPENSFFALPLDRCFQRVAILPLTECSTCSLCE